MVISGPSFPTVNHIHFPLLFMQMYISSIGQSPCKRLFISRLFTWFFSLLLRKVLRYQRGKQKHKKEDGQTIEKRHTMIYKTLHELQTKQEWIKVLRKDKQFQIHLWHSSCYTCQQSAHVMNEKRTGIWLRQTKNFRIHLWRRYSV